MLNRPGEASDGRTYFYRASLMGPAYQFELTDEGLVWKIGRRSGVWPYADIASVRLSYRPMAMQRKRYSADLQNREGRRLKLFSTSKQTAALMEPQFGYPAFMITLHERLAAAGSAVTLRAGIKPWTFNVLSAALALVGLAMAALLIRALYVGEFAGVIFIVLLSALFGWQGWDFLSRNRPRSYTFDDVPKDLLG
ncbi:hypothetical protein RPMA_20715 [Tardiphaga alba]|uniref:Uncharacterized protein n=1 Tax=Tardiphaga alba TaxID=340268 RepID=A0ABX8AGR8_9BRAD|nr:hypothetical protein RPMA_20715 [Tardiphaga alba]